jgi:hypothetical protein
MLIPPPAGGGDGTAGTCGAKPAELLRPMASLSRIWPCQAIGNRLTEPQALSRRPGEDPHRCRGSV